MHRTVCNLEFLWSWMVKAHRKHLRKAGWDFHIITACRWDKRFSLESETMFSCFGVLDFFFCFNILVQYMNRWFVLIVLPHVLCVVGAESPTSGQACSSSMDVNCIDWIKSFSIRDQLCYQKVESVDWFTPFLQNWRVQLRVSAERRRTAALSIEVLIQRPSLTVVR